MTQSRYSNNNNNNNNNNNGYYNADAVYFAYETPLCSAAYNYKETCNGSCKRMAKKSSSGRSSRGGGFSGEGFSPMGKFFLWVMSLSGMCISLSEYTS